MLCIGLFALGSLGRLPANLIIINYLYEYKYCSCSCENSVKLLFRGAVISRICFPLKPPTVKKTLLKRLNCSLPNDIII